MEIRRLVSLESISPEDWNSLSDPSFPFGDYEFLRALAISKSVGKGTGWLPRYFTAWRGRRLVGTLPVYEKTHSYGEYIFDWEWAYAHQSHRIPYYPKCVSAVPFTPATGSKLRGEDDSVKFSLLEAALAEARSASSLHHLFIREDELPIYREAGFLVRHSFQYHWTNRGYCSFDDFLHTLKSRKRKAILKERDELASEGLDIRLFTGSALESEHARTMYRFYLSTTLKMGGIPYLTESFFEEVFLKQAQHILLWLASREGEWIAGALHLKKGDALFGRYWGCTGDEEVRHLHFELCYYRALEYAIHNGIKRVEAGAQGEHKIQRGFVPNLTYSAHWIRHPAFRNAIANFIEEEKDAIRRQFEGSAPLLPYTAQQQSAPGTFDAAKRLGTFANPPIKRE